METRDSRKASQLLAPQLIFRMNENGTGSETVRTVLLDRGWREFVEGEQDEFDWNLWWRTARYRQCDYDDLMSWQRLNHFPKTTAITKKDMLARNMRRMKGVYGASVFNFTPLAFNLPNDYTKFVAEYTKLKEQSKKRDHKRGEFWICKPADSSRGRGIFLFEDLSELTYDCSAVAQRYITNPCLIAGYKFDLRLYVLVTSFHPLTVYMYQEGIVRFSTEKYDLSSIGNLFSHLTNTSINKFSPSYTTDKERVGQGCKWTLTMLRNYFHQQDVNDEILWQKISNVVILTLLAQVTSVPKVEGAFELFGFDIFVDSNLKPWLLEVNFNPALNEDCEVDSMVKRAMVHDVIDVLGFGEEDGQRGGESYAKLRAKQYNSRQRQSQFVPRPAPKSNLRRGVRNGSRTSPGKPPGVSRRGGGEDTKRLTGPPPVGSKKPGVAKSKAARDSEGDYEEEVAPVCVNSVDGGSKPSAPAGSSASNSKLRFKSISLSKLYTRESSLERLKERAVTGSSVDDMWIPSIAESRKALGSRRDSMRKREEHVDSLSSCLESRVSRASPLARVASDFNQSGPKDSLTGPRIDVSNSGGGVKGTSHPPDGHPHTSSSSSPNRNSGQQVASQSQNGRDNLHSSPPSQECKTQDQKVDSKSNQVGSNKLRTSPRHQSLYSRSRIDPRGGPQGKIRGHVWPSSRTGDFILVFPFNDVTKRASYPSIEMRTVVREIQKQLKSVICRSKVTKQVATSSPVVPRKVSPQAGANTEGSKCEDSYVLWAPLRSATLTAIEA